MALPASSSSLIPACAYQFNSINIQASIGSCRQIDASMGRDVPVDVIA